MASATGKRTALRELKGPRTIHLCDAIPFHHLEWRRVTSVLSRFARKLTRQSTRFLSHAGPEFHAARRRAQVEVVDRRDGKSR
jgi:hypothetical protein